MMSQMAVALVSAILFASVGCGDRNETTQPQSTPQPNRASSSGLVILPADSPKLSQIRVGTVEIADLPADEVTAPGKIDVNPNRVSRLLLPVPGRVSKVLVKLGDSVSAGQPLLTVDSPEADSAMSAYLQAEAASAQAKVSLGKANSDLDRTRDLFDHDAVAKKDVLSAESALAQAHAAVGQAEAAREHTLWRLKQLQLTNGKFGQQVVVRAPIAGKVLEIAVGLGEYRSDTNAPLMVIADLGTVWVSSDVPESSIRLVKVGDSVETTLDAYPGEIFQGRIMRIADTLDPKTRTLKVLVELNNPNGQFRPEMFARVRRFGPVRQVPVVPIAAVLHEYGRNFLFLERSVGQFERREVLIGKRAGEIVPVLKGVDPGNRVVIDGAVLLIQK
jgi:cobalt-zinc-cadmium efflux system membrane fusion protein